MKRAYLVENWPWYYVEDPDQDEDITMKRAYLSVYRLGKERDRKTTNLIVLRLVDKQGKLVARFTIKPKALLDAALGVDGQPCEVYIHDS